MFEASLVGVSAPNCLLAEAALDAVEAAARDGSNLMPPILRAVEAHGTLGEIADRMRAVFGIHHETFAL